MVLRSCFLREVTAQCSYGTNVIETVSVNGIQETKISILLITWFWEVLIIWWREYCPRLRVTSHESFRIVHTSSLRQDKPFLNSRDSENVTWVINILHARLLKNICKINFWTSPMYARLVAQGICYIWLTIWNDILLITDLAELSSSLDFSQLKGGASLARRLLNSDDFLSSSDLCTIFIKLSICRHQSFIWIIDSAYFFISEHHDAAILR